MLTVQFTITARTLYHAQMALIRHITWIRLGGIFVVVVCPLFMVAIHLVAGQTLGAAIVRNLGWIVGFPAFWLIGIPLMQRWNAGRTLRATPALQQPQRYTFDAKGITMDGGLSRGRVQWAAIVRVVETHTLVLLFYNKTVAYFIPTDAFPSAEALARFRALVSKAVGSRAHWATDSTAPVRAIARAAGIIRRAMRLGAQAGSRVA
ncbi:MAG TPA: YcxB family protein [Gemmatimonadaceae bacterium]|nr:YcxB family protein [Gemmatimonadaceae bacterium]